MKASVAYVKLVVEVRYVLLQVLATTGKFVDFLTLDDSVSTTDATLLAITKQLTEIVELAEQISLGVDKTVEDSQALTDLIFIATTFNRSLADITSLSDTTTLGVDKAFTDSISDSDAAAVAVTKLIADSLAMADSLVSVNFTDAEDDALAIDDLGIDDDPEWNLGKNLSDTASTTDSGLLIMQDYCDITYFAEDYAGLSRTF